MTRKDPEQLTPAELMQVRGHLRAIGFVHAELEKLVWTTRSMGRRDMNPKLVQATNRLDAAMRDLQALLNQNR